MIIKILKKLLILNLKFKFKLKVINLINLYNAKTKFLIYLILIHIS